MSVLIELLVGLFIIVSLTVVTKKCPQLDWMGSVAVLDNLQLIELLVYLTVVVDLLLFLDLSYYNIFLYKDYNISLVIYNLFDITKSTIIPNISIKNIT